MTIEFEAKFLQIDLDTMRTTLQGVGASLEHPMRMMKRAIIETPELKQKNAFMRVRDEGDKVTLTYKAFESLSVDGAKEHEVEVSDFETIVSLLRAAGLPYRSLQESKRETWALDDAEVVIDEWPWLKPYIEIEGRSERHVRKVAERLGFDWSDAVFGDVMASYRMQYPHLSEKDTVANLAAVRFGDPLPEMFVSK